VSSHREAPEISQDPVADNTDVYAFRSPDNPNTVTIVANYLPGQAPAGGPNFYEFGEEILYEIHIDNNGDGEEDITYSFEFSNVVTNPNTFLYNTGPIGSLTDPNWVRRQYYKVTRTDGRKDKVLGTNLPCPPCNIGPRSTPNYANLANAAIQTLPSGEKVFAGQRNDPFYVDLGSTFDLGTLRPFQNLHLISMAASSSVDTLATLNVHSIVIQVPISKLTSDGSVPTNPLSSKAVLGIYASASRRKVRILHDNGRNQSTNGPWTQVSRLGNPLFNEVIVPMSRKDEWNATDPEDDKDFLQYVQRPELASLLPVLYPGVFPNLAALNASGATRADLVAILLTGLPPGIIPGFQNLSANLRNRYADLLRLNVAIPPAASPNNLGILGGDLAGFPNGRRLADDIVAIELKAVAGATYPLVAPSYTPDGAAGLLTQQPFNPASPGAGRYLPAFPYVGTPHDGFSTPSP
jgi:Domain of unknown function (DUF4331)